MALPPSSPRRAFSCARGRRATSVARPLASTARRCWEFISNRVAPAAEAADPLRGPAPGHYDSNVTAIRFAERMSRLGTEGAFEVLAKARRLEAEGKHVVHLEIGEPDFATPDNIIEAGMSAMQNGYTHYTPAS